MNYRWDVINASASESVGFCLEETIRDIHLKSKHNCNIISATLAFLMDSPATFLQTVNIFCLDSKYLAEIWA